MTERTRVPCPGPASPQTSHGANPDDPETWCPECTPTHELTRDPRRCPSAHRENGMTLHCLRGAGHLDVGLLHYGYANGRGREWCENPGCPQHGEPGVIPVTESGGEA